MRFGEKIIDEITKQQMLACVEDDDTIGFVWVANADEQLDALIENIIKESGAHDGS